MQRDFKLGDHLVRPRLGQIEGPRGSVAVEGRSMAVLLDLVAHAGELRSRQELIDAVWGEIFVSEEVLSHCIWDLRRALGDKARTPTFIQTVPRQGYRLIASVSWLETEHDRYELIEELGNGSMGVVWKAADTLLQRRVALKFLPRDWSRDAESKERFLKEARAVARLDHTNVCQIYEVGETDDGRLFLVLPYYAGGTLKQKLASGPLPWQEAVSLARAVARGLAAAHFAGVIHRDIKPANLIFSGHARPQQSDPEGLLKILDFGIARLNDETQLTSSKTSSAGTPAYRSPEQTLGQKVDSRTDLWSLGVLLYEMIAGERPFQGDFEQAIVHAILHRAPKPLTEIAPEIPQALAGIVERLLAKGIDERYTTAEGVLADLQQLLSEPTTSVDDLQRTDLQPEPQPTRKSIWIALAVAAFLLSAVGLFLFRMESEPVTIVVTKPEIEGEADTELRIAAAGALLWTLDALTRVPGFVVLDPSEVADHQGPARNIAKATAADEVITLKLTRLGERGRITINRIQGQDGWLLWSNNIKVRLHPEASFQLAEAVYTLLQEAYPELKKTAYVQGLDVQPEDYQRFLEIEQRHFDVGKRVSDEDLEDLERITQSSPRFAPAFAALAKGWAVNHHGQGKASEFAQQLDRITQAIQDFPEDPRLWVGKFELERASGRFEAAHETLAHLRETLSMGDVVLLELEAKLLRDQGQLQKALETCREAASHRPSWRLLFLVADIAYRLGLTDEARDSLNKLLEVAPDSTAGLAKLAEVELVYGDLETSVDLYSRLAQRFDQRSHWNNLGTAAYLNNNFERARESYLQALDRAPGHPLVLANLADAEIALGMDESAARRCTEVLERLGEKISGTDLGSTDRMLQARCLARLGRKQEAVAVTQQTLQTYPENASVTYKAAVVYALVGEVTSALVNVERARSMNLQPRWLAVPEFATLHNEPSFQKLFDTAAIPTGSQID